jgi:tRNA nucleotidyltransferase/poly(A) polymerase
MADKITALLKLLSKETRQLGVAERVFVVGGAVRNHILGAPIKDLDLVIDSVALGKNDFGQPRDSAWFARLLQGFMPARTNLVTNNYGVAILTITESCVLEGHELKGEILEIANARRESYGGDEGKGYKPHLVEPATILEDLQRRDFTINTLLWRLADLGSGPQDAPVLDLLGSGLRDLEARVLRTPLDPDRTFSDDPTRMLRAIKFQIRHGLEISSDTAESIRRNAAKLADMPWDAVRKILVEDLLQGPDPRQIFQSLYELGLNRVVTGLMKSIQGFQRGVSRPFADMDVRLALLAIDSGWPLSPSPVSFYSPEQTTLLRMTLEHPEVRQARDRTWDPDRLWAAIKQPQIDQPQLFARHGLVGADRQRVLVKARELLLLHPSLSDDPVTLEAAVNLALGSS